MIVVNGSEFRAQLDKLLDDVEKKSETLVIKRGKSKGKGAVIISLDEYYSVMETIHLLGSRKNAERLFESVQQMEEKEEKMIDKK